MTILTSGFQYLARESRGKESLLYPQVGLSLDGVVILHALGKSHRLTFVRQYMQQS